MEFVSYEFIDSVVCLTDPKIVAEFEEISGYWSEAAVKDSNHHVSCSLRLQPIDGDRWTLLDGAASIHKFEDLIAANRCLVISAVVVFPRPYKNATSTPSISTTELRKVLEYGHRTPLHVTVRPLYHARLSPEACSGIVQLVEDLNVRRINMDYTPGFHDFLVKRFASRHLVSAVLGKDVPVSMHSHILEWAHRDQLHTLWVNESPNFKVDFSVFEKLMQRVGQPKKHGNTRVVPLNVYLSEAGCEKIRSFMGAEWIEIEGGQCWKKGDVLVELYKSGRCYVSMKQ